MLSAQGATTEPTEPEASDNTDMENALGAPPHFPVAIIGGGACGICVGAQLTRQLGWDYILVEKSAAVGGTWYGKQ